MEQKPIRSSVCINQHILGQYADQGFALEECGDNVVVLWYKDGMIAAFSQLGATRESIQHVCQQHLDKLATATKDKEV